MHIATILSAFLLVSYCSNPNIQKAPSKVSFQPKYKSYQLFIDSLVGKERGVFSTTDCSNSVDTFKMGSGACKVVGRAGRLTLNKFFFGIQDKKAVMYGFDSCRTSLQLGKRIWEKPSLPCSVDIECTNRGEFNFRGVRFLYCAGRPSVNCTGSVCRVIYYPLVAMSQADTSFYLFSNSDDITGLRYGDFNNDNQLDFLVVDHGFTPNDIDKLIAKDENFKYWECNNGQCYKISAITFADGQWKILKDKEGKAYYFLIKLDDPLNPNSRFEMLDYVWM